MYLTLWRREFKARPLKGKNWLLVYGRRKTGKTFLIKNFLNWNAYLTVTRDATIVFEEPGKPPEMRELDNAIREAAKMLGQGNTVVIDEFQRLPPAMWQLLATQHPSGRLILVASSMGVVNRVFDSRSPLLGLVEPLTLNIIRYADVIASLNPRWGSSKALKWGLLLREPWLTTHAGRDLVKEPWEFLSEAAPSLALVARGLVGEVFQEEERHLTRLYEAVLRLLGAGVWNSTRLSAILFGRGLLTTPSPGVITGILEKMSEMGLVEKTRLWKTRGGRVYYRHASPLLGIVYGLMEKYGVDEGLTPPRDALEKAALNLFSRELQFSIGELLAEHHQGIPAYTILPEGRGDADVVVLDPRGKRPLAVYEVKLGACGRREARQLKKVAEMLGAPRAGLACTGGFEEVPQDTVGLGPEELVEKAVENIRRLVGKRRG